MPHIIFHSLYNFGNVILILYAAIYLIMVVSSQKVLLLWPPLTYKFYFVTASCFLILFFYYFHWSPYKMYLNAVYSVNKEFIWIEYFFPYKFRAAKRLHRKGSNENKSSIWYADLFSSKPQFWERPAYHSITGGGFPSTWQQNVTSCPTKRLLSSGWDVTDGWTVLLFKMNN